MVTAYIALGGNLGDRTATLLSAVRELNAVPGVRVVRLSTFHDTAPAGGPPDQPRFLNAAAELDTVLSPEALLTVLLEIERQHGRTRGERNAPRTLDLDLLTHGELVRSAADPILPHPRLHERRFVLAPLAEIAPTLVIPGLGRTADALLAALPPDGESTAVSSPAGLPLQGLRSLVTGSTNGIGRAIAMSFAQSGADVIVHGRRARADAVWASQTGRSAYLRSDLAQPGASHRLIDDAWKTWNGLDICVLNAGADVLTGEHAQWPFERKLEELLAVDVTATMRMARDVGERMRAQGRGVILTVGWDQSEVGMEGDSGQLFAASKAAVTAFSKSLALTLAPRVRVNVLAPGWTRTAWGESASSKWQDRVRRETPLGRWGTPEDVASAAVWLASPAAGFITGQVIRINGGAVR